MSTEPRTSKARWGSWGGWASAVVMALLAIVSRIEAYNARQAALEARVAVTETIVVEIKHQMTSIESKLDDVLMERQRQPSVLPHGAGGGGKGG